MNPIGIPYIVQAAQSPSILRAALSYSELGLSVVPLHGKRPPIFWREFKHCAASPKMILEWHFDGLLENVGLVCGEVSRNLVVLDLDRPESYIALKNSFPALLNTYTVNTGSGKGKHLYWYVTQLPETLRVLNTPIGNLELRAQACLVVGPPSVHPDTHQPYNVHRALPIQTVPELAELVDWIESFTPRQPMRSSCRKARWPNTKQRNQKVPLNPCVLNTLAGVFAKRGFKRRDEWLNGPCICPQNHRQSDIHPSFGFNMATGYGYCFVCGMFLAKDICKILGIDIDGLGGLTARN
jgi:Bifunctional DNA primase/polymerase, N-terminal